MSRRAWLLFVIAITAGVLLFSTNPFGENPDAIADESYFATSVLSSLKNFTLPGWDHASSGAYYGGVQVYLLYAIYAPILLALRVITGAENTALFVATHMGMFVHIARTVSAFVWWMLIVGVSYVVLFRETAWRYRWHAAACFGILFSSSLVTGMVHTAKVWSVAMAFEAALIMLVWFVHQERQRTGEFPISRTRYIQSMGWLIFLITLQTYTGVLSAVWFVYIWFLRHATVRQMWYALRWHLGAMVIIAVATQWTIFARFSSTFQKVTDTLTDVAGVASLSAGGDSALYARVWWPVKTLALAHPALVIIFLIALVYTIVCWRRDQLAQRMRAVLIMNTLIYFIFYHGLLGFSVFVRYGIMLSVVGGLSAILLLTDQRWMRRMTIALCMFAFAVSGKTAILYWKPSAEVAVQKYIESHINNEQYGFILNSSRHYLPINKASLDLLGNRQRAMSRFQYLISHRDQLQSDFKPSVMYSEYETPETRAQKKVHMMKAYSQVWNIENTCELCAGEKSCIQFNHTACAIRDELPQEVTTLRDLFHSEQLGRAIRLERVR